MRIVLTLRSHRLLNLPKQFLVADCFSEDIGFHGMKCWRYSADS